MSPPSGASSSAALGLEAGSGEPRPLDGRGAVDPRRDHRPPGDTGEVPDPHGQSHAAIGKRLVNAVLLPGEEALARGGRCRATWRTARKLTGGMKNARSLAISNERLVGMDETTVCFRVRQGTAGKRVPQLPAQTFIERFLLRVLPSGFKQIRHDRLLAPAVKATKLPLARQALSVPEPDPVVTATIEEFMQRIGRAEWARCTHCHEGRFVPTAAIPPLRPATPKSERIRSRATVTTARSWRGATSGQWRSRPPGGVSSAARRNPRLGATSAVLFAHVTFPR